MERNGERPAVEAQPPSPGPLDFGQDVLNSINSISQPVEMSNLPAIGPLDTAVVNQLPDTTDADSKDNQSPNTEPSYSSPAVAKTPNQSMPSNALFSPSQVDSAIGPATDKPTPLHTVPSSGPQLIITLLLHSTETRHPYTINEKYLKKRNVKVADDNPVNMSVYTLKELIWRDWREGTEDNTPRGYPY